MVARRIRHSGLVAEGARRVARLAAAARGIRATDATASTTVDGAVAAVVVGEVWAIFEILEIHVGLGYELEGRGGGGGGRFAWVCGAHALHGVDVAEGGRVADVAVETAAVDFGEEVFALLVHHGHGELLVEGGVAGMGVSWR